MEYNLLDLIAALEEVVKKAAPFPIGKKSLVDCTEIDEIATEMRLVLPREIQQAQNIVADKNRIISDAKKEAEAIISKAEQQRRELIDQNSILQEARRRATEEISAASSLRLGIATKRWSVSITLSSWIAMQPSIVREAIAFRFPPVRDFLNLMSEIFMLILPVFL